MSARNVEDLMFLDTARDVYSLVEEAGRMPDCFPAVINAIVPQLGQMVSELKQAETYCGSPIEVQLLRAMFISWYDRISGFVLQLRVNDVLLLDANKDAPANIPRLVVSIQHRIAPYTADFALSVNYSHKASGLVVVECDGHEFHHATKEQADHDSKRDRYMTKMGIRVMRFTGSQIYQDAKGCVKEIQTLLLQLNRQVRDNS